jgi:alkylated DNA repair dioxygenase AlkB
MTTTSAKRPQQASLDTFFTKRQRSDPPRKPPIEQSETVPGLSVVPNFVTPHEEAELLAFLSAQNWRTDLARRVIHYGGTYCLMPPRSASLDEKKRIESQILTADPIPPALEFILSRTVEHGIYAADNLPKYCIVNEYIEAQGISPHVENFKFDEPVCGLTLGHGDFMRFHELIKPDDGSVRSGRAARAETTGCKVDVWMPPRSLIVMRGEARSRWQHEICRSKRGRWKGWQRTSLTFRVERRKTGVVLVSE